ncbi:MAG: double zinc ribbon domain-containing protein [Thermodesulfobacteriota bacterium]
MKCPHCGQSLGDQKCSACGTELLPASNFCHQCGTSLKTTAPSAVVVAEEEEIDFSKRILCSDGNCIGVINEKGICKVCGKPYAG